MWIEWFLLTFRNYVFFERIHDTSIIVGLITQLPYPEPALIQYFAAVTNKNIDDVRVWKIPRWSNLGKFTLKMSTYGFGISKKERSGDHNHESKWMELVVFSSKIHTSNYVYSFSCIQQVNSKYSNPFYQSKKQLKVPMSSRAKTVVLLVLSTIG